MSSNIEASEETPLLHSAIADNPSEDAIALKHELLYKRFSPAYKRIIVIIMSWSGLIPRMHLVYVCHLYEADVIPSVCVGIIHTVNTTDCERPSFDWGYHQVSLPIFYD